MTRITLSLVASLVMALGMDARASNVLILGAAEEYAVNEYVSWVTSSLDIVDPKEVQSLFRSSQRLPSDGLNLGFSDDVVWLRAEIASQTSQESWILEFAYPHLDDIDVYVFRGTRAPTVTEYGDGRVFESRARRHRTINASITVPSGEKVIVLMRVQSTSAVQISLKLYSERGFGDAIASENLFLGLYYGLMAIMMVYHLVLFLSSRMKSYLLYSCYVGTWTLAIMVLNGTFYQYFLPGEPALMARVMPVVLSLAIVFTFVFVRDFLGLKELLPEGEKLLNMVTKCAIAVAVLGSFIPYKYAIAFVTMLGVGAPLIALGVGVYALRKGFGPARYFVWGWSFFLIGALIYSLRAMGVLPAVPLTEYAIQVGTVIEVLFLSLALGDRISSLHAERDAALQALVSQSQKLTDETEKRAFAEESLRRELQGRVTLFSDAAHHLNNPLNHIDGAKRNIRRKSQEIEDVVMKLIEDAAEFQEVRSYLQERFKSVQDSDHIIENAVLRTARVVETLRAVSGADGVGYEPASIVAVLNVALERLEAVLGREGAAAEHLVFGTTLEELEAVTVIGQPSLYGLALDLLVESLIIELASTSEAWKLHLKLAVAKGGFHFHRLRFWLERSDGSMVKTPKESLILESANSIIGVYGAQATVYESGEFEMTMCADIQGLPASLRSGV